MSIQSKLKPALLAPACVLLSACATYSFLFDDATNEGFSVDGIYDGGYSAHVETCTQQELDALYTIWPDSLSNPSLPEASSLAMRILPSCFPQGTSTGFFRFDFVSPDVSGISGWSNIDQMRYAVKTNIPGIQAQALLNIRTEDGEEATIMDVDSAGEPIFHTVPDLAGWQQINFEIPDIDQPFQVLSVKIRIFGDIADSIIYWGPEALVQVDRVVAYRD